MSKWVFNLFSTDLIKNINNTYSYHTIYCEEKNAFSNFYKQYKYSNLYFNNNFQPYKLDKIKCWMSILNSIFFILNL